MKKIGCARCKEEKARAQNKEYKKDFFSPEPLCQKHHELAHVNYLKQYRYSKKPAQKFPLLISIFVITILFLSTSSYAYDREAELMAQLYETKGCAFSVNCPDSVKSEIIEEHNGLLPSAYYEKIQRIIGLRFVLILQNFVLTSNR